MPQINIWHLLVYDWRPDSVPVAAILAFDVSGAGWSASVGGFAQKALTQSRGERGNVCVQNLLICCQRYRWL